MELTILPFLGLPDGDLLEELLDLHTRILGDQLKKPTRSIGPDVID
jgi:hypothetical protein